MLKSRRFALVIGNEIHLRKYDDPSHGWIAVPRQWLAALGIAGDISGYSYQRGGTVYLEEDQDATTFDRVAKSKGYNIFVDVRHTNVSSRIRSCDRYEHLKNNADALIGFARRVIEIMQSEEWTSETTSEIASAMHSFGLDKN